ncbi:MAG: hypothetical protein JW718_08420, partial [Desulfovibrionaceae bacterium]|nr:hypothetical protein [Desulfovibrionaceae bacterium]
MNTALVLNSIAEAEDFLARREEFPDPALFSTCSSVDEFLGRRHGLKCLCLSSLLPSELASSNIIRARRMARELTEGLDRVLAADFCAAFGVAPMRLFQALYSYMAYNQCIIYLGLRRALDAVVGQGVEELLSYDRPIADFLSCATTLERFYAPLSRVPMRGLRQAAVGCAPDPTRRRQDFPLPPGLRLERLVKGLRRRLGMGTSPVPDSGSDGPAVLLLEPLYDLEFLKEALADLALVSSNSLTRAQGKMPTPASSFPDPAAIADLADNLANGSDNDPDNQAIARRVVQDLAEDFAAHLPEHAAGLAALERLRRERGLALGVWGNSPVRGFRALAAEYLLANGVEVLGAQHGGLLGNRF